MKSNIRKVIAVLALFTPFLAYSEATPAMHCADAVSVKIHELKYQFHDTSRNTSEYLVYLM